jgi:hypothetical protein
MTINIFAADIETSGLTHHLIEQGSQAKLHNLCAHDIIRQQTHLFEGSQRDDIEKFLSREIIMVMHNGICYDKNALKILGYNVDKVHFVDTLALSWYLDLNRDKHGLESYGDEFGVPKPEIKDWKDLTQEDYNHRVREDVKIQYQTYKKLKRMFEELYGEMSDYEFCTHKVVKYLNFKMEQLSEQQETRIQVDVKKAKALVDELAVKLEEKVSQLATVMPKVPVYSKHTKPAKPFKKDGSLSATGLKWKELCERSGVDFDFEGEIKTIKGYNDPNPQSPQQIKDWLFSFGWSPKTFKYSREEDGTEKRIPQIYVQGTGGQICPSIEELAEKIPDVGELVGMGVIKHRKGAVQGFLDSLVFDNYVEAGANGFTNTLRLKHRKPCVNLPSSRVLYGAEVRSCLMARNGMLLGGADLSSLENRIKFNLQLPYDREYVFSQMSEDFDPHLEIAKEALLLTTAQVNFYKIVKEGFPVERYTLDEELKDLLEYPEDLKAELVKKISEIRGKGKSANYALQYSCGIKTLARTAGVTEKVAKQMYKAYKKMNWSIDKIAEAQVRKKVSHGEYQLNPFNGFWYHLKTTKDSFSTLVQGTGSYILDLWLSYQFKLRNSDAYQFEDSSVKLLATFHDEQVIEFKEEFKSDVEKLISDSLKKVNSRLNQEIEFGCDIQFGKTYADIH